MSEHCLFIGWNRPYAGRDNVAMETYQGFVNWLGKQQQVGTVESCEPVVLDPIGTNMNGFIMVRGTRAALDKMRMTNEFQDYMTRANYALEGFCITPGYTGQALQDMMNRYQKIIGTTTTSTTTHR